jgi:hypothetical protein
MRQLSRVPLLHLSAFVVDLEEFLAYHGSEHPPSGQYSSKSSGLRKSTRRSGWRSHLTGNPSWIRRPALSKPMNRSHMALPLGELMNVSALPIMMSASRARESSTLSRSGEVMNPISPRMLLRVKEIMTMSLSSPW